jgi:hypothetical protein
MAGISVLEASHCPPVTAANRVLPPRDGGGGQILLLRIYVKPFETLLIAPKCSGYRIIR